MSPPRILLALASLAMLQGCIAAALVAPIAAGGAIVRSAVTGERSRQALVEGTDIAVESVGEQAFAELAVAQAQVQPVAAAAAAIPSRGPLAGFYTYAGRQLSEEAEPQSAILADPTKLEPARAPCRTELPAVLVDLDPEGGMVSLSSLEKADPALVATLADLRARGVAVAWMTDRTPEEAGLVRARLRESGLDTAGRDPLFVQRYPGERKQARRSALGETHCVIAILGDARADFDDLYDYIRDPAVALPLEELYDNGWFLIDDPLE